MGSCASLPHSSTTSAHRSARRSRCSTPRIEDIDLSGWTLKDKQKNACRLGGTIGGGETLRVNVTAPMALSNKGGIISVLDGRGVKVHGVAYTKKQASQPGRTLAFGP